MAILTGLTDDGALKRILQLGDPALREWAAGKLVELARRARDAEALRFSYAGRRDTWHVGPADAPLVWRSSDRGARLLHLLALNANRWHELPEGRSRRAYHAALSRALESLAQVHHDTSTRFEIAGERNGPGIHLRERNERVAVMWRPRPGAQPIVASTVTL
jgi:hypothetical protein